MTTQNGLLSGQVGIVTGGGSGIGKCIAIALAQSGAHVALADLDLAAAQEAAKKIESDYPGIKCLPIECNVADEISVQAGFKLLIETFGQLNILVNAAGVAPSFPLVEMPLKLWQLTLDVNLTGYFLMAKEAAKIMIAGKQGGSIVNISSKSGIDASKNNSPYNATKAGELHMSRGWALELGEHGIRSNCICPGNVFEGSKIWNKTYIAACAKKKGIAPEEVIPHYINMSALKKEIKGENVADSVVYLCSDMASCVTGQFIVVDSGQAMAR